MQFKLAPLIMTIIQANYPGGLEQFNMDGGSLGAIPSRTPEYLIIHPNLPEDIKGMMSQAQERFKFKVSYFSTPNFEGVDNEPAFRELSSSIAQRIVDKFNTVDPATSRMFLGFSPAVVVVSLDKEDEDIRKVLTEVFEETPGLLRAVIVEGSKVTKVFRDESSPVIGHAEMPKRDTTIQDDDILNLKIALGGDKDVMDIINEL